MNGKDTKRKRSSSKDSDKEKELPATRPSVYKTTTEDDKSDISETKELSSSKLSTISKLGLIGEQDYFSAENDGKCAFCLRAIRGSQPKVRCDSDCRRSFHLTCTNLEADDLEALSNPHLKWACGTSDCRFSGKALVRDIKAFDATLDKLLTQMESIRTESVAIRSMLGEVFDNMKSIRKELAQIKQPQGSSSSEADQPPLMSI